MSANEFIVESDETAELSPREQARLKQQSVRDWVTKIYAQYPPLPDDNTMRMMDFGDGIAAFKLSCNNGTAYIEFLNVRPRRHGFGTKAIKELQQKAREDGITLTLSPGGHDTSTTNLKKFYRSVGFRNPKGWGDIMVWGDK